MVESAKTVVIIEDEPDAAEMLGEMMRVSGFRVVKSYSSGTALNLISTEMPDVVILDIMMPDISGLDVLRSMQQEPRLAEIPVVVVSAKSMSLILRRGWMLVPRPI